MSTALLKQKIQKLRNQKSALMRERNVQRREIQLRSIEAQIKSLTDKLVRAEFSALA